jgi:predicted alpha/beta-hydrolase family hydrolase
MNQSPTTVVFSHGQATSPWGEKITAMAAVVRDLGLAAESVDYQGIDEPQLRVEKLLSFARPFAGHLVLAGSSLGGHVSAAAARSLGARGLFLLAPAFFMPGFEEFTPRNVGCPAVIVHGWRDDIVPVDHSVRWAHEHRAALHVLDSGHRLQDQLPSICLYLRAFLQSLG